MCQYSLRQLLSRFIRKMFVGFSLSSKTSMRDLPRGRIRRVMVAALLMLLLVVVHVDNCHLRCATAAADLLLSHGSAAAAAVALEC
jgi:hypothetical protein